MPEESASAVKPPPLPVIGLASRWTRIFAALLDFTIIALIAGFILSRFLLPENFPEVYSTILDWHAEKTAELEAAVEAGEPFPEFGQPPVEEKRFAEMVAYALAVFATFVWAYFFVSESLMRGSTLGKATFSIRVLSLRTGQPPTAMESALRAAAKSFTFLSPSLFLPINLAVMAFNQQRRAGHDLLARTIVISGRTIVAKPATPSKKA
ncbi:MAG: RDD family protein [Puniceicoccales bacterium]